MGVRDDIQAVLSEKLPAKKNARALRERRVFQIKADAVAEQFANHPGKNTDGVLSINTPQGDATIYRVEVTQIDGLAYVDVWISEAEEPEYRLINPPMLVEDPSGPVILNGRRFREDPLAAVAEAVAAQQKRGRR